MGNKDDTLRTGAQASEDTLAALLETGQLPGIEWAGTAAQLPSEVSSDERVMIVYRVPRAVVEIGWEAGGTVASDLALLPEYARGGVVLSFDGWAEDTRPLFLIPCAVAFCRGLLGLGTTMPSSLEATRAQMDIAVCSSTLEWLLDELQITPPAWEVAGALWCVAHAFPDQVFGRRNPKTGGWARDPVTNLGLKMWLQEKP